MTKPNTLRIIPLGGVGEVGKNMMVYEFEGDLLIVDAGLMFPENDMLGVDYLIPDMQYLNGRQDRVRGIVITHGHEDHIGAIQHVLEKVQAPIYATPLTMGLLEVKLARHNLTAKTELMRVQAGETVAIGKFQVEFFHVSHSIPDSVGLGIQTPAGLVVHTGDFKFDHTPEDNWPTDFARLAEFSQRGVLALLADSTYAERGGWTPSERVVDQALEDVFVQAPGRIIVASFASLVSRLQQVANAATRHNRKLALAGTSMVENAKIARKLGYLNLPDALMVPLDQALNMKADEVVIMCTGSQGEPASILGRLSTGKFHQFDIKPGDTVVVSSHPIPGNEEDVYRTINRLFQRGADVIYEGIAPVHVSGHASQEELKLMLNLTRPKFFIPVHGELRHLRQHARLAEQVGIPSDHIALIDNGQVVEFHDGQMKLAERVPSAYVFVDGRAVGDVGPDVMREREALSREGVVIVTVVIDRENGFLFEDPRVDSHGFILPGEADQLLNEVKERVAAMAVQNDPDLENTIQKAVRTYLYEVTHRRPVVCVTVSRV